MTSATNAVEQVFRTLDPPLWVVTSAAEGERGGLLASFVNKASTVPELPRMLVGIGKGHHTWNVIERSQRFVLHLLGPRQVGWVETFGMNSSRDLDKFAGLRVGTTEEGLPTLLDAPARLECRVESAFDVGDRTLYLGEVVRADAHQLPDGFQPLTFGQALSSIPPEALARFGATFATHIAHDAQAIHAWRSLLTKSLAP